MRKIIARICVLLLPGACVFGAQAQEPVKIALPEMKTQLDSVSFYIGMVSGFDMADDIESVNFDIVNKGLFDAYLSGESYSEEASAFLSEFLESYIYSDNIALGKEMLKTLPDTDPLNYRRRHTGVISPADGMNPVPIMTDVPHILTAGGGPSYSAVEDIREGDETDSPYRLKNSADSAIYYRAMNEGYFVARWLPEVEVNYLLGGVATGFLVGSDNFDFEEASGFLENYFESRDYDDYEDYYSRDWKAEGFPFPENMELPELATEMDTVSFVFGMYLGQMLAQEEPDMTPELFMKGMLTGYGSGDDELSSDLIYSFISYYFEERAPEIQKQKLIAEVKPIMDSLAALPRVSRTESGLLYEIIRQGDMNSTLPDPLAEVELEYTISFLGGETYETSGVGPEECNLGDMMSGISEGLGLIGKGGRIKLYIPPGLTDDGDGYRRDYGSQIFEAEITLVEPRLQEIKEERRRAEVEAALSSITNQPGINRTASGLFYRIIEQGDMSSRLSEDPGEAELIYTISYFDGVEFESSNGRAETRNLPDMMAGFVEGLRLIGKGGTIKLYIPPGLTDDADGYERNRGNQIFEAEVTLVEPRIREMREERELAGLRAAMDSVAALPGLSRTASGLYYEIIEQGDMDHRVTNPLQEAKLIYSIYYHDGDMYNSSYDEPEECSLGDMMEGLVEGVMMIGKGGRIKLYIPPALTNDADGYARSLGNYVFIADVTLVDPQR